VDELAQGPLEGFDIRGAEALGSTTRELVRIQHNRQAIPKPNVSPQYRTMLPVMFLEKRGTKTT
jgi:hypothetical protein